MKLIQEQRLPGGFELICWVVMTIERRDRAPDFGLEQTVLCFPVEFFYLCLRGQRATMKLEIELSDGLRQAVFG